MVGKIILVVVIAQIAALNSVQAHLKKYVDSVASGKEGVQQACYVQAVLWSAITHYRGEPIMHELERDMIKVRGELNSMVWKNPETYGHCYKFQACADVGEFNEPENESGERDLAKEANRLVSDRYAKYFGQFKECWQGRLANEDPEEAKRLAKAAKKRSSKFLNALRLAGTFCQ